MGYPNILDLQLHWDPQNFLCYPIIFDVQSHRKHQYFHYTPKYLWLTIIYEVLYLYWGPPIFLGYNYPKNFNTFGVPQYFWSSINKKNMFLMYPKIFMIPFNLWCTSFILTYPNIFVVQLPRNINIFGATQYFWSTTSLKTSIFLWFHIIFVV